ncbi:MAG: response regulator transcription factor [Myxococcales bacterium]|nr:response regulator transcription factor [Myxococcales bacterium]
MGNAPRILVVEDDVNVVQGLLSGLRRSDFDVSVAMDGARAMALATSESFDLVVLDLMLPEQSGLEVLGAMRGRVSTPVIVLSARTELQARLDSFAAGAVDYVGKPFFIEELVARIQTRLALHQDGPRRTVVVGSTTVDLDARKAWRDGLDVKLTAHEFNVLAWLAERPNRAVSRGQLAEHVLGTKGHRADRTVDSHLSRVRRKLGPDATHIKTVWGIGYRFEPTP